MYACMPPCSPLFLHRVAPAPAPPVTSRNRQRTQAKTFEEVFERVELSPMDFVRLMDVAERRVVPKGSCLSREGRVQEEVFLIVEGAAQVWKILFLWMRVALLAVGYIDRCSKRLFGYGSIS